MRHEAFLSEVTSYREELQHANGWGDLKSLWRKTLSPYHIASVDPLSMEYRAEILALYEQMTGTPYHISNEMTSSKVAPADFDRGFPWMTQDAGVAASEMAKVVQALRVIDAFAPGAHRVVEFGAGWGNLAISLAQLGQDVTTVDLDPGFCGRLERLAARNQVHIKTIQADFLTAARAGARDFDAVIFQSSFHHCMEFRDLLASVCERVLRPDGRIFFFAEPIFADYARPWGLRTDGESIWAITANKWCELGFDQDFFINLLQSCGMFGTATGTIPGIVGEAWVATPAAVGLDCATWMLPGRYDQTLHPARKPDHGRFLMRESLLPALPLRTASLTLANYAREPLTVEVACGRNEVRCGISPGSESNVQVDVDGFEIKIKSDCFIEMTCMVMVTLVWLVLPLSMCALTNRP